MFTDKYYVDKETGTPSDTLLVFGLARLLSYLRGGAGLTISDMGDCYCISLDTAITPEQVTQSAYAPFCTGIEVTTKKRGKIIINVPESQKVDYEQQRAKNDLYYQMKAENDDGLLAEANVRKPDPDWYIWAFINHLLAMSTYNKFVELWHNHQECFSELIKIILDMYSLSPNQVDSAQQAWSDLAKLQGIPTQSTFPQLQVVNPVKGKGFNRAKADRLLKSASGRSGFWIPEYLKFSGLYRAAIPRMIKGENTKDRKTYILRPKKLTWLTHEHLFDQFRDTLYAQTSAKMDVIANLNYAQLYLKQWREGQDDDDFLTLLTGQPDDYVSAIECVYHKKLNAYVLMNISSFALPHWLPNVTTIKQAIQFSDLLQEHLRIMRQRHPRERKGHEYAFLDPYRDFLSGHNLQYFYRFMRAYSQHIESQFSKKANPPQFTIQNLEVLIMAHDQKLSPILQNQGFKNVANAIRQSTVRLLYLKSKRQDPFYEIRYGLGDKLIRKAQYPDEFAVVLGHFMFEFNKENARKRIEAGKRGIAPRYDLSNKDIDDVIKLMDDYKPATVANLLVAYGYAFDADAVRKSKKEKIDNE